MIYWSVLWAVKIERILKHIKLKNENALKFNFLETKLILSRNLGIEYHGERILVLRHLQKSYTIKHKNNVSGDKKKG